MRVEAMPYVATQKYMNRMNRKKWKPMGSFIIMTLEQFTGEIQYGIQKNIEIYANLAMY